MKRIIYVDNFSTGIFQEVFNTSSLKMMSTIFEEVVYYTSNSVKKNTYSFYNEKPVNITHRFIPILNFNNSFGNFIRHLLPIFTSIYVILKSKKSDIIYFNYNVLWAMPVINFLSRVLNKKIILMCHGEMEYLVNGVNINFLSTYLLRKFKSNSFEPANNLYFCVIGVHIKKNLVKLLPNKVSRKLVYFNHSHIFKEAPKKDDLVSTTINVGVVGTVRENKWLSSIMELGNNIKSIPHISFSAVGRVYCKEAQLVEAGINIVKDSNTRFLSRAEMNHAISKLDYVLFLYPVGSYKYTASGALFDAIDNEKQILALKNDYFNDVFNYCPELGSLFNNIQELTEFIKELNDSNKKRIDYENIKNKLSPQSAAKLFKSQLKNNFNI